MPNILSQPRSASLSMTYSITVGLAACKQCGGIAQARVSLADRGMKAGLRSAALQTLAERLIPAEELEQRVRDQLSAPHRTTRTCTLVAIVASASASSQRPTIASRGMLRGC